MEIFEGTVWDAGIHKTISKKKVFIIAELERLHHVPNGKVFHDNCHTLKLLDFRMWLKVKLKQQFSHNFKIFPIFIFLTENLVLKNKNNWLSSERNKVVLFVLHSCCIALFYCLSSDKFKFKWMCLFLYFKFFSLFSLPLFLLWAAHLPLILARPNSSLFLSHIKKTLPYEACMLLMFQCNLFVNFISLFKCPILPC